MSLVPRWTLSVRLVHWGFALAFLALLGSGLALGNPDLRGIPFLGSKFVREVHLTWAVLLVVLPALAGSWDGFVGLRAVWHDTVRFDSAGRFNTGQKLNVLAVTGLAIGLGLTGLIIAPLGASPIPQALRELVYPIHVALAYCTLPIVLLHVLLATLVPGTRGALRGMLLGSVSEDWARAHHARWLRTLQSPSRDSLSVDD